MPCEKFSYSSRGENSKVYPLKNLVCLPREKSTETDTESEKEAVTRYGHWVWKGDEPQQENKKTGTRGVRQ